MRGEAEDLGPAGGDAGEMGQKEDGPHVSCLEGATWSGLLVTYSGVCRLVLSLAASSQLVLYLRPRLSAGG